jgi:hypothetical protein
MGITSVRTASRAATNEQVWNGNTAMIAYAVQGRDGCAPLHSAGLLDYCKTRLGTDTSPIKCFRVL